MNKIVALNLLAAGLNAECLVLIPDGPIAPLNFLCMVINLVIAIANWDF